MAAVQDEERSTAGGEETILLAEDDPAVRQAVASILEAGGYQVIAAGDGGEAIRLAEQHDGAVALLLTDVVMPDMSGRELANLLVDRRPGLAVLFMSGYTDNAIVHHGRLDPGTAFIQKPFGSGALLAKLRDVLDRR